MCVFLSMLWIVDSHKKKKHNCMAVFLDTTVGLPMDIEAPKESRGDTLPKFFGEPSWVQLSESQAILALKRRCGSVTICDNAITSGALSFSKRASLISYSYDTNVADMATDPGIYYLAAPPEVGYVVRRSKGFDQYILNTVSKLELRLRVFYRQVVRDSYLELALSDKHPDLDSVLGQKNYFDHSSCHEKFKCLVDPEFVTAISLTELFGAGKELFYSIDRKGDLNGFAIFGEDRTKDYPCFYVSQMGSTQRGLGSKFIRRIMDLIEKRVPDKEVTLHIGTRFGNKPAEKLYGVKFNMQVVSAMDLEETMGLSPFHEDGRRKYVGYKAIIGVGR